MTSSLNVECSNNISTVDLLDENNMDEKDTDEQDNDYSSCQLNNYDDRLFPDAELCVNNFNFLLKHFGKPTEIYIAPVSAINNPGNITKTDVTGINLVWDQYNINWSLRNLNWANDVKIRYPNSDYQFPKKYKLIGEELDYQRTILQYILTTLELNITFQDLPILVDLFGLPWLEDPISFKWNKDNNNYFQTFPEFKKHIPDHLKKIILYKRNCFNYYIENVNSFHEKVTLYSDENGITKYNKYYPQIKTEENFQMYCTQKMEKKRL